MRKTTFSYLLLYSIGIVYLLMSIFSFSQGKTLQGAAYQALGLLWGITAEVTQHER